MRQRQGRLERDDISSNRHPALSSCLSMSFIAKPVLTFAGHALVLMRHELAKWAVHLVPGPPRVRRLLVRPLPLRERAARWLNVMKG